VVVVVEALLRIIVRVVNEVENEVEVTMTRKRWMIGWM
jgi:hypothetical protein